MPNQSLDDPDVIDQGAVGDTHYYMKKADLLPLLMPLEMIGVPRALLLVANAPLQVLIEGAYRRDIHPGEPTPQYLIPINNPLGVAINFLRAIPVGIDDGLEEAGLPRVFGTQPAGPYGVGGNDEELKGLPAGFIPLGKSDPKPHTSQAATNNVVVQDLSAPNPIDVTGHEERADVKDGPPVTDIKADVELGSEVKKEVERPLKSVLKDPVEERLLKSALMDRLDKSQKTVRERPKPMRPESVRPGAGERPLRKALKGVRGQGQNATRAARTGR